jgi:hypothetical protein
MGTTAKRDCDWILAVISSCNNQFHIECADKLIELYKEKYKGEDELHLELDQARITMWNEIHNILT